jgi:hypothetical protein
MINHVKYLDKYKSIVGVVLLLLLSSCSDNKIYFDVEEQQVKTCNGKIIENLHLTSESGGAFYHFKKIQDQEGTRSFSLLKINENYKLEGMTGQLSFDQFKLKPKTEYKVTNSTYGDAAPSCIIIETDDSGKITNASVTSCD